MIMDMIHVDVYSLALYNICIYIFMYYSNDANICYDDTNGGGSINFNPLENKSDNQKTSNVKYYKYMYGYDICD